MSTELPNHDPKPFPGAVLPSAPPPRKSDRVKHNYWIGIAVAVLVLASFVGGRYVESLKPAEPSLQCEGRLIGIGESPPLALQDVDFADFWRVWQTVKERHVSRPSSDLELFYGAMRGLVGSLDDPYSSFFTPKVAQEFSDELSGTFQGIGAEIGIKHEQLTVIAPLPDTPADRAGLQPRDLILAIDGQTTFDMTLDYAVSQIRGPKDSTVVLTIGRKGWTEPQDISIVRGQIVVSSVRWRTIQHEGQNIGYISISNFNTDTESAFNQAVRAVLLDDPAGLVLDLRNNPGGFLDTAVKVAGEWVPNDVVLLEKFSETLTKDYVSNGLGRFDGLRTVVLVNGGSASASEIVSGALQDYDKATVVGETTYGKGSVQDYIEYEDGSALKLTVARWYTPEGRSIDKDGLEPDIWAERSFEDFNNDLDPPLDRALELLVAADWPPPPEPKPEPETTAAVMPDESGASDEDSTATDTQE
jgi:carboxyl-terminal processing protease